MTDAPDEMPADTLPIDPRAITMAVSGLAASVLLLALSLVPVPYAVTSAGPTHDTLRGDGPAVVAIEGTRTYPATGSLYLTTVSVYKASDYGSSLGRTLRAWLDPHQAVQPVEAVFGRPEQEQQFAEQAQQDWITAQELATVAALAELGTEPTAVSTVVGLEETSLAQGLVKEGDVVTAINGTPVPTLSLVSELVDAVPVGGNVTITVNRAGTSLDVTFATIDGGDGTSAMGLWVDPTFDLPIDVSVAIDTIGGPSAGMMYSLAIIDQLTPEDELDGQIVAGTGTISVNGDVGPIGGIRFKLNGAKAAGATWFLAPIENCSEVIGHVPEGVRVVAVDTLHDARVAMEAIGAGKTDLNTCS